MQHEKYAAECCDTKPEATVARFVDILEKELAEAHAMATATATSLDRLADRRAVSEQGATLANGRETPASPSVEARLSRMLDSARILNGHLLRNLQRLDAAV